MARRKPEVRSARIGVRVTPTQYEALEVVAERANLTVSDLVREAVEGLVHASTVAGPAFEGVVSGTLAEKIASVETLQAQARQQALVGNQIAENYGAVLAELRKQQEAEQSAERAAS